MLIDAFDTNWLDHLAMAAEHTEKERRTFFLIDGAFVPGLRRAIQDALAPDVGMAILFEALPSCSEKTRDVSPFLFEFHGRSRKLIELLGKCKGWPMVSMIATPETLSELSLRLSAWCIIQADGQRFNFRFADTRRLPGIFKFLNEQQQSEFAGPALTWSYIGRQGKWEHLPLATRSPEPARPTQDPELDEQQFAAMVGDSEADEILSVLVRNGSRMPQSLSARYSSVLLALETASAANLDAESRIAWCEAWLQDQAHEKRKDVVSRFEQWLAADANF